MDTRSEIIQCARDYIQTRGYNAFSFRDIAEQVGIRSASIHHHFPSKTDLGLAVITEYRRWMFDELAEISRKAKGPEDEVLGLTRLLSQGMADGKRICLCAMLMSDAETLPQELQQELVAFLSAVEQWFGGVLERGRKEQVFAFEGSASILGRALFASFQGMMLCARAHGEPERFVKACRAVTSLLLSTR